MKQNAGDNFDSFKVSYNRMVFSPESDMRMLEALQIR